MVTMDKTLEDLEPIIQQKQGGIRRHWGNLTVEASELYNAIYTTIVNVATLDYPRIGTIIGRIAQFAERYKQEQGIGEIVNSLVDRLRASPLTHKQRTQFEAYGKLLYPYTRKRY